MKAPQRPELRIVRGLETDGEPVDAGFQIAPELVAERGGRIHLDGDLRAAPYLIGAVGRGQDPGNVVGIEQRGRAASDENAADLVILREGRSGLDFPAELLHIVRLDLRLLRKGQEVAVIAFPCAEGNVNIQLQLLFVCRIHYTVHYFSSCKPFLLRLL